MVLSAGVGASTAHADRRAGLAGNQLIEDKDDVFKYPQLTTKYRNRVFFDYGGPGAGNAAFLMGNEDKAIGIAVHRGDLIAPRDVDPTSELRWLSGVGDPITLDTSNIGAPTPFESPATVFDLMGGMSLGGDRTLGARLGLGHGNDVTIDRVGPDDDRRKSVNRQTFIMGQVGVSNRPDEGPRTDIVGSMLVDFAKQKQTGPGPDNIAKGFLMRGGASGRRFRPINDVLDVGFLGDVEVSYEKVKNDLSNDASWAIGGSGNIGAGPSINLDRAKVAGYATLGFGMNHSDPTDANSDDRNNVRAFALPGVRLSTEVQLTDWLYARTGADYRYRVEGSKENIGDDANVERNRNSGGTFAWNVGIGAATHGFTFDGVVSQGLVTNGPQFIGGNDPGFLAMASIGYVFGDVLGGGGSSDEAEEEEVEASEPEAEDDVEDDSTEVAAEPEPSGGLGGALGGSASIGGSAEVSAESDTDATGVE